MATESQNPFSNILNAIPGYRGYRTKEDRRDADRRVREKVAASLGELADRVETVARSLANQRQIAAVGPVDEFAQSLHRLINRVSTATYGYGGLFSDRNVDEQALDQIRQFDESLLADIAGITKYVEALERAHASGSDLSTAAAAGIEACRQLNRRFETRSQVIETAKPAPPESVQAVIAPTENRAAPEMFDLHERDAVTISGENYVVDGRIDIEAGQDSFRLFRLDESKKLWLLVPSMETEAPALVNETESSAQDQGDGSSTSLGTPLKGSGSVIAGGRKVESRSVTFSMNRNSGSLTIVLDWGGERQQFEGKEIAFDDVEIFPAAG